MLKKFFIILCFYLINFGILAYYLNIDFNNIEINMVGLKDLLIALIITNSITIIKFFINIHFYIDFLSFYIY